MTKLGAQRKCLLRGIILKAPFHFSQIFYCWIFKILCKIRYRECKTKNELNNIFSLPWAPEITLDFLHARHETKQEWKNSEDTPLVLGAVPHFQISLGYNSVDLLRLTHSVLIREIFHGMCLVLYTWSLDLVVSNPSTSTQHSSYLTNHKTGCHDLQDSLLGLLICLLLVVCLLRFQYVHV